MPRSNFKRRDLKCSQVVKQLERLAATADQSSVHYLQCRSQDSLSQGHVWQMLWLHLLVPLTPVWDHCPLAVADMYSETLLYSTSICMSSIE